jgi:hypothetical protein
MSPGLYSQFCIEKITWLKLLNTAKKGIHRPNIMLIDDRPAKIGINIQIMGMLIQKMFLSFRGKSPFWTLNTFLLI